MRKYLSIVMLSMIAVTATAVPARRGAIIRTAADGTEKEVYLHGNAFGHYMTDAEGTWLDETSLMPMSEEAKQARLQVINERKQARRVQAAQMVGNKPNAAPRGLLILVNFADKAFVTPYDTIKNMLDGDNFTRHYEYSYTIGGRTYNETVNSAGSARQYFHDQSYGQYNPIFDVVGPYTLSQNLAYYGKNSASGDDANVGAMVKEACELADKGGADFTLYDNDNNGIVDFVYILYAGYGEADGGPNETVWPHNYRQSYYGTKYACTVDGKKIDNYACSNEINYINDMYNGIGTFCHEFSHVLGLPDLYETNVNLKGLHTLLDWDILDYGPYLNDGNTPPNYSAYERFFMGWLTPRVLKDPQEVWLNPIHFGSGDAILLCEGDKHNLVGYDPDPKVFYLLEARKKEGWDKHLPGRGMLITKISYNANDWANNTVNNNSMKMGVDLLEAKANNTTGSAATSRATDAYPAGAKFWAGFANHDVTDISINNYGAVIFSYRYAPIQGLDETPTSENAIRKELRDGQIYLMYNGKMYNVQGQEVK